MGLDRSLRRRLPFATVRLVARSAWGDGMPQAAVPAPPRTGSSTTRVLVALAAGALVALSLGIYGRVHDPTGRSLVTLFFTQTITLKVWFATGAVALAVGQLLGGLRMYGKLGKSRGPRWIRTGHR